MCPVYSGFAYKTSCTCIFSAVYIIEEIYSLNDFNIEYICEKVKQQFAQEEGSVTNAAVDNIQK